MPVDLLDYHSVDLAKWQHRQGVYLVRRHCLHCATRRWMREGGKTTSCLRCGKIHLRDGKE